MKKAVIIIILLHFLGYCHFNLYSQQLAFPGAEGFGKYTTGGRGGMVVEVTNLNDAGAGSLRDALTGTTYKYKKRTIVFKVSGIIELQSEIQVKYDSCITIAGQTAPGDGICIKNFPISLLSSKNIIIRYMRFRLGDKQTCTDCDMDAFTIKYSHHIILDHCSFSWSIDDVIDLTDTTGYATIQYCIISEPLNNSKHSKGAHGYAAGLDGNSRGYRGIFGGSSFHHNLIACANSRSPRLDSYAGMNNTGCRDLIDFVNNVIYNWSSYGAYGGEHADVNWQNNYYRYGPNTSKKFQIFQTDAECKIYVSGNYVYGYPSVTTDNSKGIYVSGSVATASQLDTILIKMDTVTKCPIPMETALDAFNTVLANAGAILPVRDTVDKRIVNYVKTGTGSIIDSEDQVGGWPILNSATAPIDSDHDGMPDDWEIAAGLNPNDASDRNGDKNLNGYTNLEDFLNGININTGIHEFKTSGYPVVIYPNPVNYQSILRLNLPAGNLVSISLYDNSGNLIKEIYKDIVLTDSMEISLSPVVNSLKPGIYFCCIETKNYTTYKKLVVTK